MTIHDALRKQAQQLAIQDPRKPVQVSLRRAISAAYYALFHLLIDAAIRRLVAAEPRLRLGTLVSRAFAHGEMRKVSKAFAAGTPPAAFAAVAGPVPRELQRVADAFVSLQEARHDADYNVGRSFSRHETLVLLRKAEEAFAEWKGLRVQGLPAVDAYLTALLIGQLVRAS